jgi:hypothetical protein
MKPAVTVLVGATVAAWAALLVWGVCLYFKLTLVKSTWKPTHDAGDEIERPSGNDYVLRAHNGEAFYVLNAEAWAMARAAKACYMARQEHAALVAKYRDSPDPPSKLHGLPDTLHHVAWAQKSDERVIEHRGTKTYLFVELADRPDRDVVVRRLAEALDHSASLLVQEQLVRLRDS